MDKNVRIAVFDGIDKKNFKDNKEYDGIEAMRILGACERKTLTPHRGTSHHGDAHRKADHAGPRRQSDHQAGPPYGGGDPQSRRNGMIRSLLPSVSRRMPPERPVMCVFAP